MKTRQLFFQLKESSVICINCKRKLTSFVDFKREIDEKHHVLVKTEPETENIDFISLGLDEIKQEILEPECVVYRDSEEESNGERFVCSEENCRREFFVRKSLIVHKNRCHSHGKQFWCCKCDKIFSTKKEMVKCQKLHVPEVTGKAVKCPECSNKFPTEALMISHRNKSHGTNIFYCKPCKISYSSKVELVRCQKLHYANKIAGVYINCPECDKKLKKYSLHLHLKFFHEKKRDQQCQVS